MRRSDASEFAAAGRTDERAYCHIGVSGPALVTVETLPIERPRHDLTQCLEILLVLFPFRGCHDWDIM